MSLSIIIPVWNNYKQLNKCLASIAEQSILDWEKFPVEVIVVDDGSTEKENIGFFKNLIGRIQYYRIEHGGAPRARNFGFAKSTGKFVFFCDSDVVFTSKKSLEILVRTLQNNADKAYVYSAFRFGWKKFRCVDFDALRLKKNNFVPTMSLVRREALLGLEAPNKPFDESLKKFQDWDLWLAILAKGGKGLGIKKVTWRAEVGGTMSSWRPRIYYKIFKKRKRVGDFSGVKKIVQTKHGLISD